MTTTHTQGEWQVESTEINDLIFSGKQKIAATYSGTVGRETAKANAKLIAAAPRMLEALLSVNKYFVDLQNERTLINGDESIREFVSFVIKSATN